MKTTRFLILFGAAFFGAALQAQPAPATNPLIPLFSGLLQDVSLGAEQASVKWTDLSNKNSSRNPVSGSGVITPFATGYGATYGFYSYSNDYAFTISTSTTSFSIGKVVVQAVMMANPDFWDAANGKGSSDAILYFDYNNQYFETYGHPNPEPLDSNYNTALNAISVGVADYAGGPVLSYVVGGITYVYQGPATGSVLGTGVYSNLVSGMEGWYYDFSWAWDLSGIDGITAVSIDVPVVVHQATGGASLTIASAVPEPATYAAFFGAGVLGFALWHRRRRSR